MPGPLPKAADQRRRRNAPTIPTTALPASGREGPAPECPYELGPAGVSWWVWAWSTPQAAAWSDGDVYALGRRASLEDDLAVLAGVEALDVDEALDSPKDAELKGLVRRLAALCSGRLGVVREMRDLDDRFGLTAKGLAQLRWQIVADVQSSPGAVSEPQAKAARRRIKAVDAAAV